LNDIYKPLQNEVVFLINELFHFYENCLFGQVGCLLYDYNSTVYYIKKRHTKLHDVS